MIYTRILLLFIGCVFEQGQGQTDPIGTIGHTHPHPDPRGLRLPSIIQDGRATDLTSGSTNTVGETRPDGSSVTGDISVSGGTETAGGLAGTPAGTETQGFVNGGESMSVETAGGDAGRAGGFVGSTLDAGATGPGGFVGGSMGRSAVGAGVGRTMNEVAPGAGGLFSSAMNRGAPGAGGFVGGMMNRGAPGAGGFVGGPMNRGAPGAGGFVGGTMNRGPIGAGRFVGSTMNRGAADAGGFVGGTVNRGAAGAGGFAGSTMEGGTPNTMRGLSDPLRVPGGLAGGRDVRMQTLGGAVSPPYQGGGPLTDSRFSRLSGFVGSDMGGTGAAGGLSVRGSSRPTITSTQGISSPGVTSFHLAGGTGATVPFYDEAGRRIPDPSAGLSERDLLMRTSGAVGGSFAPSAGGTGAGAITSTGGMASGRLASAGVQSRRLDGGRGLGPIIEGGSPGLIGAGIPTGTGFVRGGPMTGLGPMAGGPVAGMTRIDPFTGRLISGSTFTGAPVFGGTAGRPPAGPTLTGAPLIDAATGRPLTGSAMTGRRFSTLGAGGVRYIPGTAPVTGAGRIDGLTGGTVRAMDGGFVSSVGGALPAGAATAGVIYPGLGRTPPTGITAPGVYYTGLGGTLPAGGATVSTGGSGFSTIGGATALPDGVLMSGNTSSVAGGSMGIVGGSPGVGLTGTPGVALPPGSIVLPADMRGSGGRVVYERRLTGGTVDPRIGASGTTYFVPFRSSPRFLSTSSMYPTGGFRYMPGPIYRPGFSGPVMPGFIRGPGIAPPMFSSYPMGVRPFF